MGSEVKFHQLQDNPRTITNQKGIVSEVYNMDCVNGMRAYPDQYFDLCIADPPYGINFNMNAGLKKGEKRRYSDKKWDIGIPELETFIEMFRVSKNQVIWGGNYFTEYLPATKSWIFWDKHTPDGVSFADGELAWTSFDKTLVKVSLPYSGFRGREVERFHPTQKPVRLYEWVLKNYTAGGGKILDPFLGSGSSRIASYNMGFDFVGFELDEDYFKAGEQRFQKHISQLTIF